MSARRARCADRVERGKEVGTLAYLVLAPERTIGVRFGDRLVQLPPAEWASAVFEGGRWVVKAAA